MYLLLPKSKKDNCIDYGDLGCVFIKVLNPFVDKNKADNTPIDNRPPLFVSTKSRIVSSVTSYMFWGIICDKKFIITSESISGIILVMYGISVKRKMTAGNTANVKLKATARDFSKISSSISLI